jgi:hypothetical protein
MMIVGVDPGTDLCGWAILDFTVASSPVWFDHGIEADMRGLVDVIARKAGIAEYVRAIAIEQPRGRVRPERANQVLATAWEGGRAQGLFEAFGFDVITLGGTEWRRAFIGQPRRGDKIDDLVHRTLWSFVRGMPSRTNVHTRDAAGVACIGARKIHALPKRSPIARVVP